MKPEVLKRSKAMMASMLTTSSLKYWISLPTSSTQSVMSVETNMRDWLDAVEIPVTEVETEGDNLRLDYSPYKHNLYRREGKGRGCFLGDRILCRVS